MFERLSNPPYWKSMVLAAATSNRWPGAQPCGSLLGWSVWAMDGKAYLFRDDRDYCRRCCWFDFCRILGWMFPSQN